MSRSATAITRRLGFILMLLLAPGAAFTQPLLRWVPTDLGTLDGDTGYATGINSAGQVVGSSTTAGGLNHAFISTGVGGMIDLGTLGESPTYATAINEAGQVAGTSGFHAFNWTAESGFIDLGPLGGPGATRMVPTTRRGNIGVWRNDSPEVFGCVVFFADRCLFRQPDQSIAEWITSGDTSRQPVSSSSAGCRR